MAEPRASRPDIPDYGIAAADEGMGLLPWSWAEARLAKSRTYWVATVRPEGRPHVMPVWGLWLGGQFVFSTSPGSRKARNFVANPHCVVTTESGDEAVIVEGRVRIVEDPGIRAAFVPAYLEKYAWDTSGDDGPLYALEPETVFGFMETGGAFTQSATRWRFDAR